MDVKLIYLDGFVVLCLDVQSQVATAVCVVIANMTLLVSDLVVHLFHVAFHLVLSNQDLSALETSRCGNMVFRFSSTVGPLQMLFQIFDFPSTMRACRA